MIDIKNLFYPSTQSEKSEIVPLLITCIVISVIILMPLKILGYGFLPLDDVLRHAGKAISGRDWNDILILRQGAIKIDTHPGYHALLGFIYRIMKFTPDALVSFAIAALFIIFCMVPVLFTRRPEAWLASLFVVVMIDFSFIMRLCFGRPYIVTMAALMALCFLWPRLKSDKIPYGTMCLITALIALSTWIHCTWYLLIFTIICFVLARENRAASRVTICMVTGILLGALLTGHPILFISQNIVHAFMAYSKYTLPRMLVIEFRPLSGNILAVIAVVLMLSWRYMRGTWDPKRIDNPVFILAVSGWVLGFFVGRFWYDWGIPALLVWMTQEFEEAFTAHISEFSARRFLLTIVLAAVLYAGASNDINNRWSTQPAAEYLYQHKDDKKEWLPQPGGILYSDDLRIFYLTFYQNPHAPWRYMVGFHPAIMPQEDLDVFIDIQSSYGVPRAFSPWVKKMKPADRLIITPDSGDGRQISELEWHYLGSGFWSGRLK